MYLDDVPTFGKIRENHERHLRDILKKVKLPEGAAHCKIIQVLVLPDRISMFGHIIAGGRRKLLAYLSDKELN